MRTTPHGITTHPPVPARNPYDELGALADNPLDEFLYEDDAGDESQDDWQPPNHRGGSRRRRTRFAGLPLAGKILVLLLALTAFLCLGDRWALLYTEHEAAAKLKDAMKLSAAPEVEIEGFPFLTQVLDDRLDTVHVTVPDVAADRVSLAKVSTTASDVRINGGLLDFKGAEIGEMNGEVLLSFDDLNRELGASQVRFTGHGGDQVLARGTLPVAGHELKVAAEARIQRSGDRGISTRIGGMRLDIGDLATYRPGTGPGEGLHLSGKSAREIRKETDKVKALFAVPAVVERIGVPKSVVQEALRNEHKLAELTGSPRFVRDLMKLNLIDVAMGHPWLLKKLGLDPALLDSLASLTRPRLADQLSLGFELPRLPGAENVRLRDVTVEEDGIRVRLVGYGVAFAKDK
ncbi:LmeA family phospholipid-binding protein [Streptomyces sp. NPDC002851]